jgi:BirA family biotin operon repressor/biotin-[acetyl-CoA-carboxylase] ligase
MAAKSRIGIPFVELSETDSTNIYATRQVQANMAAHGAAFFAYAQYAGKGQRGKSWDTEPGSNIILSILLDSSFLLISQQFHLSVMAALACHDFYSRYAGDETKIKWPNDIYWRDRKAGGILIENLVRGNKWQWSVAGMGLNINQTNFPAHASRAVSLRQITGRPYDAPAMARELCSCLENRYQELKAGNFETMLASYNQHLFMRNEKVKLKKETIGFNCTIKSVNTEGALLVDDGIQEQFRFGEVEWIF